MVKPGERGREREREGERGRGEGGGRKGGRKGGREGVTEDERNLYLVIMACKTRLYTHMSMQLYTGCIIKADTHHLSLVMRPSSTGLRSVNTISISMSQLSGN